MSQRSRRPVARSSSSCNSRISAPLGLSPSPLPADPTRSPTTSARGGVFAGTISHAACSGCARSMTPTIAATSTPSVCGKQGRSIPTSSSGPPRPRARYCPGARTPMRMLTSGHRRSTAPWRRGRSAASSSPEVRRSATPPRCTSSYPRTWTTSGHSSSADVSPTCTDPEKRERWLSNGEIHALFRHLAGQPDEDDYEFENPPHPQAFLFTQVHFLGGAITPAAWLRQVCDKAATGTQPALVT